MAPPPFIGATITVMEYVSRRPADMMPLLAMQAVKAVATTAISK
jgi:hypothetical protein